MAAAARTMLVEGRMLRSLLVSVSSAGRSTCTASKRLRTTPAARHVSITMARKEELRLLHSFRCMATTSTTKSDIITQVKHDHEELEEYFANYKAAHHRGDEEDAAKWFHQFVWEVSRHAVSEELVLYPLMVLQGQRGKDLAETSRADHQQTKEILEELQNTTDPVAFDQKMDKMMAELREHIRKEESEDLTYLQQTVSAEAREVAGSTFGLGKKMGPTRPHPGVPNKPAALEAALGLLVTPMDKLRDLFTSFPSQN